jgi:hypothetical protein
VIVQAGELGDFLDEVAPAANDPVGK